MEKLLALRVLHDPARLVVRLHGHALLVPADRFGFLLERGDHAGKRSGVVAELLRRLVVLIRGHGRANLVLHGAWRSLVSALVWGT